MISISVVFIHVKMRRGNPTARGNDYLTNLYSSLLLLVLFIYDCSFWKFESDSFVCLFV